MTITIIITIALGICACLSVWSCVLSVRQLKATRALHELEKQQFEHEAERIRSIK